MESGGAGEEGMGAWRGDDIGKWSPTCSRDAIQQQKIGRVSGRPREPVFCVSHTLIIGGRPERLRTPASHDGKRSKIRNRAYMVNWGAADAGKDDSLLVEVRVILAYTCDIRPWFWYGD